MVAAVLVITTLHRRCFSYPSVGDWFVMHWWPTWAYWVIDQTSACMKHLDRNLPPNALVVYMNVAVGVFLRKHQLFLCFLHSRSMNH